MRTYTVKKYFLILLLPLLYTSCEYPQASDLIEGRWITVQGVRLELSSGTYTKISATGDRESGNYSTQNGLITFNQPGTASIVKEYGLRFPILTIGELVYYSDAPAQPEDLTGVWFSHPFSMDGKYIFSSPGQRPKNPNVIEAEYETGGFKGIYKLTNRYTPNSSILTLTPTHLTNLSLLDFIDVYILEFAYLFDTEELGAYTEFVRWISRQEVIRIFDEAGARLQDRELLPVFIDYQSFLLDGFLRRRTFTYYLKENEDFPYLYGNAASGKNYLYMLEDLGETGEFPYHFYKSMDE